MTDIIHFLLIGVLGATLANLFLLAAVQGALLAKLTAKGKAP